MIMINAPRVTLDVALQSFIRRSLYSNRMNMVLFVPTFEMRKFAFKRLQDFLFEIPVWLAEPLVRVSQERIDFMNGCSIRIFNNTLQSRGVTIDYCAMYQHQDYPWDRDEMYSVLPAIKGPLDQHFTWVTE